ncbi:hypothetical protein [Desulfohalovibrio reitneri]|uniref:hypothetical protein n=1 Tax=Desulfohalovibrio reitneri TaxID=1307759 RepID=UPI0004A6E9AE|nr:hypothetical protein [Desulfohalovibrio reitneri]
MRVLLLVLLAALLLPPSPARADGVDLGLRLGPGFTFESLRLALPGVVETSGKIAPDGSSADLTGTLRDPARALALAGVDGAALADLGPVDFDLAAERSGEAVRLDLGLRPRRFAPWSIRVDGELRGDTLDARASLFDGQGIRVFLHITGDADAARLTLDLGESGALHGTARPRDASLRLSGDGLKLAPLLGLLRDLPGFNLPPGSLSGLADVELTAAAPDRLELDLGVRQVALSAAEGRLMSEQLAVDLRARSRGQSASLEVTAPSGQVLAGNWFADLGTSPPSLSLSRQGDGPPAPRCAWANWPPPTWKWAAAKAD